jgi:ATPase subunit of ABC transporter with duplicated ATPase domains
MAEFIYTMVRARKTVGEKLILDDVTMSFFPGAKIGMVGPNGAGKSTILKIMAGLDTPSNGEAQLSAGYSVGILMQEPELDESKTVLQNVQDGVRAMYDKLERFNQISLLMSEPDAVPEFMNSNGPDAFIASCSARRPPMLERKIQQHAPRDTV